MTELTAAFRRKSIAAFRWHGKPSDLQLRKFFGRLFEVHEGNLRVYNLGTKEWLNVPQGSWVFKLRNGDLFVVSDEAVRLFARLR